MCKLSEEASLQAHFIGAKFTIEQLQIGVICQLSIVECGFNGFT